MERRRAKSFRVAARLWRPFVFGGAAAVAAGKTFSVPPWDVGPEYHRFADARTLLGIPNALDVLSNLPFLLAGAAGLWLLVRRPAALADRRERAAWLVFFGAVTLIAVGSAWYHLEPTNGRLVWDRLPMSIAFMALLSALVGERTSALTGRRMLLPAVLAGIGSVLYWRFTDVAGHADLRAYIFVQFFPMAAVPLLLIVFPARYTHASHWLVGLALYALAKVAESSDARIFGASGIVSGHTVKHLVAALAIAVFVRMVACRARLEGREPGGRNLDPADGGRGRSPARIST